MYRRTKANPSWRFLNQPKDIRASIWGWHANDRPLTNFNWHAKVPMIGHQHISTDSQSANDRPPANVHTWLLVSLQSGYNQNIPLITLCNIKYNYKNTSKTDSTQLTKIQWQSTKRGNYYILSALKRVLGYSTQMFHFANIDPSPQQIKLSASTGTDPTSPGICKISCSV